MTRRAFAKALLVLSLPAVAYAQRATNVSTVPTTPPVAASPAETKILQVLDRMVSNREQYQPVDAVNGRTLRLLVETTGAKNVVEIGTSTGYSGLWTCLGLRTTGGRLTTFEIDPGRATQARKHFDEGGVGGLVEIVVGDAHQKLSQIHGPIDLVFLDADKEGYASYLKALLPLVRPGGLIAADNIAMAPEYVKAVTTDPQLETVFFGRFAVTMKKR